ncbi:MAG: CvpA family protein [Mariprofundaceae bacterium]
MNPFDYLLIAIVGLSMVISLWRGFVREMIAMIGLIAAFLVAARTSAWAGDQLGGWISNDTVADVAGFIMIFVLIVLVVALVGAVIRRLMVAADLSATDRTLGLLFGLARGVLLIGLGMLIYTSMEKPTASIVKRSVIAPYAIELGNMLGQAIPAGYPFSRQSQWTVFKKKVSDMLPDNGLTDDDREKLQSKFEELTK